MAGVNVNAERKTILIVDDSSDDIAILSSLLKDKYRIEVATNMEKALQVTFSENPPNLVLIDIMMSGMVGYKMCRYFKSIPETNDIPVIFLTANYDPEEEKTGFELGAVDYITEPVNPPVFLARINTHLQLKGVRDFLKDKAEYLEQEVARRTKEISMIQDVTMVTMGSLAETRDNETANHIRRTQNYVKLLASHLKNHPRFNNYLTSETIMLLFKSTPLHDMGKVGIPDHILLKPGELTLEEFEIMKTHTTIGRDAIISAEKLLGTPVPFLRFGMEIAYGHHEKWNGAGYPEGLSGDDISIPGRLMAVADVYDALISRRVYKPPYPHEESVDIIREAAGTHFDPDMVKAFLELADKFNRIAQKYADSEEDVQRKWPLK